MPVTLKDIAARIGISQVAVSQVLRGKGNISPQVRRRVMAVAKELRYRPHGLAQSMRGGRTGLVGLVYTAHGVKGNLPMQLLVGVQRELATTAYELLMAEVTEDQLAAPGEASSLVRRWMADGLLINHQLNLPPQLAELVDADQVPAIWINSQIARNAVYFDDRDAGRRATAHLIALGHTRIGYVDYSHPRAMLAGNAEHYSVTDRFAGYRDSMIEVGLSPVAITGEATGVWGGERMRFSHDWLSRTDRPTAVITYGPTAAIPVLFAATSLGLSVPGDLSLIDFSPNTDPLMDRFLTTMVTPYQTLGEAAVRALVARVSATSPDGAGGQPSLAIPLEFAPGQTVGPPAPPSKTPPKRKPVDPPSTPPARPR